MELENRISEIDKLKIPHTAEGGNTLSNFKPGNSIIYEMHENIPEIKFINFPSEYEPFNLKLDHFAMRKGLHYYEALAKIKGEDTDPMYFAEGIFVDTTKIELHAFYNPVSNMSHYFILPRHND